MNELMLANVHNFLLFRTFFFPQLFVYGIVLFFKFWKCGVPGYVLSRKLVVNLETFGPVPHRVSKNSFRIGDDLSPLVILKPVVRNDLFMVKQVMGFNVV